MQPKPAMNCDNLKKLIREVPDFPKKGILFYDITTLLKDNVGFATLIDALSEHYLNSRVDLVLGIEARGFIFGPALAYRLNAGFVPVRKPKKLPAETAKWTYDLEYGSDTLEIHKDAIAKGQRVLIVDDLLATGGTANATVQLARSLGADVVGVGFVVELTFLGGRQKLAGTDVFSLMQYDK
ncbi:MAG TPA: adenine phosphoribosyltransferase [Terriglobales bacterium]|nr:adenine phosphoribosyltransferase [Terriglobales bacterium]